MAPEAGSPVVLEIGDREVRITNPDRVYFPARGETKLGLRLPSRDGTGAAGCATAAGC